MILKHALLPVAEEEIEFHETKVASGAGLLAYRELDEARGLTTVIGSYFYDNRLEGGSCEGFNQNGQEARAYLRLIS